MHFKFQQITPVTSKINDQWVCATPESALCPPLRLLEPLKQPFNLTTYAKTLGDGLYSKKQMDDYAKLTSSKTVADELVSEMAESFIQGEKSVFNFWPILQFTSIRDLSKTITDQFFGIFASMDRFLYPALTIYAIWSAFLFLIRMVLTVVRVLQEHGLKLSKLPMALLDPIIYLMWLSLAADFGRPGNPQHPRSSRIRWM